jgi:hypothetical protein
MINDFPQELSGKTITPLSENLFKVDSTAKKLGEQRAKQFHTFVMKGMFLCKRGRQDIQTAVAFMATRITEPNEGDWKKLVKMMNFLKKTKDNIPVMSADDTCSIYWHIDAAFAIHMDMKSHTGGSMTLGAGTITSISSKQKVNTRSSTESEMVGLDDGISKILWSKLSIEEQGYPVRACIIYCDNTSSMKLEENGRDSCGKCT